MSGETIARDGPRAAAELRGKAGVHAKMPPPLMGDGEVDRHMAPEVGRPVSGVC